MTVNPAKAALLNARLPRYTSYPPANRFTADVGQAHRRQWLASIAEDQAISLYLHIPFCRRLCWFCACSTRGTKNQQVLADYVEDLATEIRLTAAALGRRQKVAQLHIGGGTPTFLPPEGFEHLNKLVRDAFDLEGINEFSVEIDPCEFDAARSDALGRAGMTRASIGVQDFDPKVQNAIGRLQGQPETARAVGLIRAAGVHSLNFDLLYGLPFQTHARLGATLQSVIDLSPDRIALYGYAHVPWVSKRQKLIDESALPSPEMRLELAQSARQILTDAGYEAIGIDHFAKPDDSMARAARMGGLRRNFQGYTTDRSDVLLGLGASAISRFTQGFSQNSPEIRAWKGDLTQGRLPAARGYDMKPEDRIAADIIERLMCEGSADIHAIVSRHGGDFGVWARMARETVDRFAGIGVFDLGVLSVTDMAYARLAASGFDKPEALDGMKYSMAS